MVVIALALVAATVSGYAVYQWLELRQADKTIAYLLAANAELEDENKDLEVAGQVTRLILGLALRQNAQLKHQNRSHETNLLLLLGELEGSL